MSNEITNVPEGFKANSKGHLVPESKVDPVDSLRDDVVMRIANRAEALQQELKAFKEETFKEMQAFHEMSMEQYGIKPKKGDLGNTLRSFDGRYRVRMNYPDVIEFDERILAAKELIDQCLADWTQEGNGNIRELVSDAFSVDKSGKLSTVKVTQLRKYKWDDPRWMLAMEAIADSMQVVGQRAYLLIHKRHGDASTESWEHISLSVAAL